MGDQQAASPESLIFVSDVCSPLCPVSFVCSRSVDFNAGLCWAGKPGWGASGLCLAGPLLLGGSSALVASGRFER